MHTVIGKDHTFPRAINYARIQKRMDIAMYRLHIAAHAAGDFADEEFALAGHSLKNLPALGVQYSPHEFDRNEGNAVSLRLAPKGSGHPLVDFVDRRYANSNNIFLRRLHNESLPSIKRCCQLIQHLGHTELSIYCPVAPCLTRGLAFYLNVRRIAQPP